MVYAILGFIVCGIIILWSGKRLSHYGDLIAELTGMGKLWLGMVLMASITSLPELIVGISSSAIVKSADLAVGDILGSCAINLGILAMLDVFSPKRAPLLGTASTNHILAAAFGIILVALAGAGLFLQSDYSIIPGIGLISISFAVLYFLSMRIMYSFGKRNASQKVALEAKVDSLPLRKVIVRFSLFALIIIASALMLPHFAEIIAAETGLGESFVGTLFLAVSTSLPEVAVSFAAIRIGSADMAVGNLLGSNIFNIFILFLDDIAYTSGQLLKDASDVHLISVFAVLMMSAVAIIGLMYRSTTKRFLMAWDSLAIFMIYILNLVLLYQLS